MYWRAVPSLHDLSRAAAPGLIAGAVGLAYFVAAYLSLWLTQGVEGLAAIWPANGLLVAALLLSTRTVRIATCATVAIASIAANFLFGASLFDACVYTIANIVEGTVICAAMLRFGDPERVLDRVQTIWRFLATVIGGSALGALIASTLSGHLNASFFLSWFTTVSLGSLIVTPLVITVVRDVRARRWLRPNWAMFGMLAVIAAISFAVFSSGSERFLFLPVLGVVVASYLFSSRGAALSISTIAVIAIGATRFAPEASTYFGINEEILVLQLYLLSLLFAAWPLVALIGDKEKLIRRYAETNQFLRLAESTAHVGHWFLPADQSAPAWSEEVFRIHGLDPAIGSQGPATRLQDEGALLRYHPADRERVREILLEAMENRTRFTYEARIVRPDGEIRMVSSIGLPRFDRKQRFEGLFGTLRDITEQTEAVEELRLARLQALHEAATAQRLSETDDLTGIANRRKVIARLHGEGRGAARSDAPLTIAILDIDHFKSVNDRFGHHMGDEVLKRVAQLIDKGLEPHELVGQLGGEEFLVLLPQADEQAGFDAIERLRVRIEGEQWPDYGPERITVSAGLVTLRGRCDVPAALRAADKALYAAKQGGRNALRTAA